jgi:hypothetical protein
MQLFLNSLKLATLLLIVGSALAAGGPPGDILNQRLPERTVCTADFVVSATALPYTNSGDLAGANAYSRCGLRKTNEQIYRVEIAIAGSYTFSTCGSGNTDTYLDLRTDCCAGTEIARNDDGCGSLHGPASLNCITLAAGTYYLIVEAGSLEGQGPYTLSISACSNPCTQPDYADGVRPNNDGTYTLQQTVDATTHPAYQGPFTTTHGCVDGQSLYGFDYLCWYDNDFGWTYSLPEAFNENSVCLVSASLKVCGWDVDFSDCRELYPPDVCEQDIVYFNDTPLSSNHEQNNLEGSNQAWSQTVFTVPTSQIGFGINQVRVDFDEHRTTCDYAGMVHRAVLEVVFRATPCNTPPYPPQISQSQCTTPDSIMCVTVTGPTPADPENDPVTYSYAWYHSNHGSGYAFVLSPDDVLPCRSAAGSAIGDAWLVKVTAHDDHGHASLETMSDPFVVTATCEDNNLLFWDYGDLDTTCYRLTGTEATGGPANAIREFNIAWLGETVTRDDAPRLPNLDTGDDGITFLNAPWTPCSEACVDVRVNAGPGYTDQPLYLYAWKDGNLNCSFEDRFCGGDASECIIPGAAILGLHAGHDSTYHFCFTDPGVTDLGQYNGVLRFRLISQQLNNVLALTWVDSLLGETEDYVINDLQLAVELQNFAASYDGSAVVLSWTTATEHNNDHFVLERRNGSGSWERLQARINGAGSSSSPHSYVYRDQSASAANGTEYRLIAVDLNGLTTTVGSTVTTLDPSAQTVQDFRLYSAYPNPFNPSTTIAFDVKETGLVTIMVYDVTGREVAKLVNSNYNPGRYNVTFDAQGLPSGLYLYRMSTPGFSDIQKMILLK